MGITKRWIVILSVLCTCGFCDQTGKFLAGLFLSDGTVWSFFSDTIRTRLVHNEGGVMSLGATASPVWQWFLIVWTVCVLLTVLAYALSSRTARMGVVVSAALVFSGGATNLVDRLVHHGSVVDFININVTGLRVAVFNLADVAIIAGFLLLVVVKLTGRTKASPSRMKETRSAKNMRYQLGRD
jgi:signal peptidase II